MKISKLNKKAQISKNKKRSEANGRKLQELIWHALQNSQTKECKFKVEIGKQKKILKYFSRIKSSSTKPNPIKKSHY